MFRNLKNLTEFVDHLGHGPLLLELLEAVSDDKLHGRGAFGAAHEVEEGVVGEPERGEQGVGLTPHQVSEEQAGGWQAEAGREGRAGGQQGVGRVKGGQVGGQVHPGA